MIAFLLAELRDWRALGLGRAIAASAVLLAALSAIGPLHPVLLSLAMAFISVATGWGQGNGYRREQGSRRILIGFPAGDAQIAAGKALSGLAFWLAMAFALSPVLVASAAAWGLAVRTIAACLASWLASYLLALGMGFLSSLVFERSEGLLGLFLYLAALSASLTIPVAAPANPFVQVWDIVKLGELARPLIGSGAEALGAFALFAAGGLALRRTRRRSHA